MTHSGDDGLVNALRELRAEHRAEQEGIEEAAERTERATRPLSEVALEYLYRGDRIRATVGQRSWAGVVVHVGSGMMTLRSQAGVEIDVAYRGLTSIRVVERARSGGRSRISKHPGELVARLRELENTGETVEVGGRSLAPGIEGTIDVVARSHVEFRGRDSSEWIVPLTEIDVVVRQPGPER